LLQHSRQILQNSQDNNQATNFLLHVLDASWLYRTFWLHLNILAFNLLTQLPFCNMHQMAAFNIQEALIWKEKIEMVIDQV
jgi:hypothetical protein